MHASIDLGKRLLARAGGARKRIGIGVTEPTDSLLAGLRTAADFCEPCLYGVAVPGFRSIAAAQPAEALFDDLERGEIDAAVRGQVHAIPFRTRYEHACAGTLNARETLVAVFEFPHGRPMLMSPVSNLSADGFEDKRALIEASIRVCQRLDLPVRIGLLARCRQEDLAFLKGTPIERSYEQCEQLTAVFGDRFAIRNYGIDFEKAYADGVTILIEPDGTAGNQVIRTLYFLEVVRFFGAPYPHAPLPVVETFSGGKDYPDVMLLAAALANSPSV